MGTYFIRVLLLQEVFAKFLHFHFVIFVILKYLVYFIIIKFLLFGRFIVRHVVGLPCCADIVNEFVGLGLLLVHAIDQVLVVDGLLRITVDDLSIPMAVGYR